MSARVRLAPAERREQLLGLGVQLMATRSLDELSIDLLADEGGVSRGLLYHYFGNKQQFLLAVMQRMAADIYSATAPPDHGPLGDRLWRALAAYVDYVARNHAAYLTFVQAARGGNAHIRVIYDQSRAALTDRIFETATPEELLEYGIVDSGLVRLFARSWGTMVEDATLAWLDDPAGVTREELLMSLTLSLGGLLGAVSGDR